MSFSGLNVAAHEEGWLPSHQTDSVNVETFAWYIFSHISRRVFDAQKFDVSGNSYYDSTNRIKYYVPENLTVSEIKGAPCTRRAHFHGWVHDFRRCAPGVCTFFGPFIIAIY